MSAVMHDARGQQEQYVALKRPVKKPKKPPRQEAETVKRSGSKLSYKLQRELGSYRNCSRSGGEAGGLQTASGGCFLLQSAA